MIFSFVHILALCAPAILKTFNSSLRILFSNRKAEKISLAAKIAVCISEELRTCLLSESAVWDRTELFGTGSRLIIFSCVVYFCIESSTIDLGFVAITSLPLSCWKRLKRSFPPAVALLFIFFLQCHTAAASFAHSDFKGGFKFMGCYTFPRHGNQTCKRSVQVTTYNWLMQDF